jgi:hypothetical protein
MFKWLKDKIYRRLLSKIAYTLYRSWIDTPTEWKYDRYNLYHKNSAIRLWRANGRWFFNVEVDGDHYGFSPIGCFERHILWHEHSAYVKRAERVSEKKKHDEILTALDWGK